jgi:hypothetical protein
VNKLLQLAIACGLAACGPDDHLTAGDANGSDAATLTAYVIQLVQSTDQTPRPYSEFGSLPDPDGDANNTAAYRSLFQ